MSDNTPTPPPPPNPHQAGYSGPHPAMGWVASGGGTSGFGPGLAKDEPEPEVKLSIEPLIGFRMWYIETPEGSLRSISFPYVWTPGWQDSECLRNVAYVDAEKCARQYHPNAKYSHTPKCPRNSGHLYPKISCGCGFYAYFDHAYWTRPVTSTMVTGVIEAKGRVITGTKGMRAGTARIVAICTGSLDEWLRLKVTGRYSAQADVYEDEDEMLYYHPLSSRPSEP